MDAVESATGSDHRLFPRPISIHGVEPATYDRYMRRRFLMALGLQLALCGPLLAGLLIYPGIVNDSTLWAIAAGALVSASIASVGILYVSHRIQQRPIALNTTYELWPDCLVSRVAGSPPVVVRKDSVAGVAQRRRPWKGLTICNLQGEWIAVPECVNDFEPLWRRGMLTK
jgi:hypothetical protein